MNDSNELDSNEKSSERCETSGQQLLQVKEEPEDGYDSRDHLNTIDVDYNSVRNDYESIETNCNETTVTEEIHNKTTIDETNDSSEGCVESPNNSPMNETNDTPEDLVSSSTNNLINEIISNNDNNECDDKDDNDDNDDNSDDGRDEVIGDCHTTDHTTDDPIIASVDDRAVDDIQPFICQKGCLQAFQTSNLRQIHENAYHPSITTRIIVIEAPVRQEYRCPFHGCDFAALSKPGLARHMTIHSRTGFKCDWNGCDAVFKNRMKLNEHKRRHENQEKEAIRPLVCDSFGCGKGFATNDDLVSHKESMHAEYRCKYYGCDAILSSKTSLANHLASHTGNGFKCDWLGCNAVLKNRFKLSEHKRKHENHEKEAKKPFLCDSFGCGKRFETNNGLVCHKETNHAEYRCPYPGCNAVLSKKIKLLYHMDVHSNETFRCNSDGCQQVFDTRLALEEHRKAHVGSFVCDYDRCGYAAITLHDLDKHKRNCHLENNGLIKCSFCDKSYKDEYGLNLHILKVHPELRPDIPLLVCDQRDCQYKTKSKAYYDQHKASHRLPLKCDTCYKRFAEQLNLENHKNKHTMTDRNTFKCPDCGKEYKDLKGLRKHKDSYHKQKTIGCDVEGCKRLFSSQFLLKEHKKRMHQRFVCEWPECSNSYSSQPRLNWHMNIHKGLKPFRCQWPECDKAYADQNVLNVHIKRHKGEHIYLCRREGCDFKCSHWMRLKRHQEEHLND